MDRAVAEQKTRAPEKIHSTLRKNVILAAGIAVLVLLTYMCFGVFVVQPIGAVPDGATIVFWRFDTKLPFIASADGIILENSQQVSLLSRGIVLGTVSKLLVERKIISLPYSRMLYLYSTGGKEFQR